LTLPALYTRWLDWFIAEPPVGNKAADCANCSMCSQRIEGSDPRLAPFASQTKCCTYLPVLHNFRVGRILRMGDGPGPESVRARIRAQVSVTPLAIDWPHAFEQRWNDAPEGAFGRDLSLACPHKVGDLCGIWSERGSTCSTWFCKYDDLSRGDHLWDAMSDLLNVFDRVATWYCVEQGGGFPRALLQRLAYKEGEPYDHHLVDGRDGPPTLAQRKSVWGHWLGREEDWYLLCATLVDEIDADRMDQLGGKELEDAITTVQGLLKDPVEPPGTRLRFANPEIVAEVDGDPVVAPYNIFDPQVVPRAVLDLADDSPTILALWKDRLGPYWTDRLRRIGVLKPE